MVGARITHPKIKDHKSEFRCMLDSVDFEKLVSGKAVSCEVKVGEKTELVKIALKDIGYKVMEEIIANAKGHDFVTEPFND